MMEDVSMKMENDVEFSNATHHYYKSQFDQNTNSSLLLLKIESVECGAFDDQDRFCVGWKKVSKTKASFLCFDLPQPFIPSPQDRSYQSFSGNDRRSYFEPEQDEQFLTIRIDHDLIRMKLIQISNIFLNKSFTKIYLVLKFIPSFLQDSVPKEILTENEKQSWLSSTKFDFNRFYDYFDRVCGFKENIENEFARSALVYRLNISGKSLSSEKIVKDFFFKTKGQLKFTCLIDEKEDRPKESFDCEKLKKVLEKMEFEVAYQLQSLVSLNKLLPIDIVEISKDVFDLMAKIGDNQKVSQIIRQIRSFPINRGPHCRLDGLPTTSMKEIQLYLLQFLIDSTTTTSEFTTFFKQNQFYIHTALLTPSFTCKLEGPNHDQGNRILRQFSVAETKNFLRLRFIEEDGMMLSIRNDVRIDCQKMLKDCYGSVLGKDGGLMVGGKRFYFLACSNSGLRELTFWFVHPFQLNGTLITPDSIRSSIGDLSEIRNPAKFAARLGQAFTTSMNCLSVKREWISIQPDIETRDGKYEFSDGIGMISPTIGEMIMNSIENLKGPTKPIQAFQIRLGGSKGMLVINPLLKGNQIILRKSMVKFPFKKDFKEETITMEIPNFYPSSLPLNLNRQVVSLLGSLGVSGKTFLDIQKLAIESLEKASTDFNHASQMYKSNGLGRAVNVKGLLNLLLTQCDLNGIQQIPFLRDANNSSINYALRRIKYHARMAVPDCVTLVGVLDEFSLLFPFEIVACIFDEQDTEPRYLFGPCLIGRNPMLAPGDCQMVKAIVPPINHPLRSLHNVVIFSQKGNRPLPNMLSGGDLDGDIFNIFQYNPILQEIQFECEPSNYESNKHLESNLKRNCKIEDCTEFFLDYIRLHQVGQIANRHLQLSDQKQKGNLDFDCIRLSQMHSIAVDFCKTGISNQFGELPKLQKRQKPDFMQKEGFLESNKTSLLSTQNNQFYQSNKPLGLIFRSIDVFSQTNEWAKKSQLFVNRKEREKQENWKRIVWDCLIGEGEKEKENRGKGWQTSLEKMHSNAQLYHTLMNSISQSHSGSLDKLDKLTEEEVFMGHILIKNSDSHQQKLRPYDASSALQDDFEDLCKRIRLIVLFKPSLRETDKITFDILWRWLTNEMDVTINKEDVKELAIKQLNGTEVNDKQKLQEILSRWKEELLFAVRQGCAWYDVTVDNPEYGRSSPWIIVPSILKAHQCLDCIEQLVDNV